MTSILCPNINYRLYSKGIIFFIFSALLTSLLPAQVHGQAGTGALSASVVDANNRRAIKDATVTVTGAFGNLRRGQLRGQGSFQVDLSLKRLFLNEEKTHGVKAEMKIQIFNISDYLTELRRHFKDRFQFNRR